MISLLEIQLALVSRWQTRCEKQQSGLNLVIVNNIMKDSMFSTLSDHHKSLKLKIFEKKLCHSPE